MKTSGILVLDLGSPTTFQVARCLRQLGVYAEVHPADVEQPHLASLDPRGIVLSGGGPAPIGVDPNLPRRQVFDAGLPVLALGDGMLLLTTRLRGKLRGTTSPGFGMEDVGILRQSPLFETLLNEGRFATWMRLGPLVDLEPPGFVVTAKGEQSGVAAMEHLAKRLFALRFHPERAETEHGLQLLANFAHDICECPGAWDVEDHAKMQQMSLRSRVGSNRVACVLSDDEASLVVAVLAKRATNDALAPAILDDGHLPPARIDALQAFARQALGGEATLVPTAGLPPGDDVRLDAVARRLDCGFVIVPCGRTLLAPRAERRSSAQGAPAPVVHLAMLGELFPDEVHVLARSLGIDAATPPI